MRTTATARLVLGTICWLAIAGAASAQTISAGVKAGMDIASVPNAGEVVDQISGIDSVDVSATLGLIGGGFVQFSFNDRVSLQPELLFVQKGASLDLGPDGGDVSMSVNYIELALMGRFTRTLGQVWRGYVMAGPSLGLKAGTDSRLDGVSGTIDFNLDPAISSRDVGLVFAGGLERSRYLLEARYSFGLSDIATSIYEHESSLKNRVFAVMIGVRIP
jgi:hypothetical protein